MIAQTQSATLIGIDAIPVMIEVDLQGGVPAFVMVGLPDKAVEESKERVRTAIRNSELEFPLRKIICNLAPGDIKKEGPALDLPIAAAILAASGQISLESCEKTVFLGELSLDGTLRPVDGALSAALMCNENGMRRLILPTQNAPEAAIIPNLEVYGVECLRDVVDLFQGNFLTKPYVFVDVQQEHSRNYEIDFAEIKGQRHAVRALEIAAAGGHNVLMIGPPGSGKTMLASRLSTILPRLTLEESIAVTRIYSASGMKSGQPGLMWERPFRAPHHTSSYAALVGGSGNKGLRPGEVSLAHYGVLFLDEMPEFSRGVLEALRQPLENGSVTISRVQSSVSFPADCILIGAMNPCPCGFKGYPEAKCVSSPAVCSKYGLKISGPMLDRIDLNVMVPRLKPDELVHSQPGESSENIRERVMKARERQHDRFGKNKINAKMNPKEIRKLIPLSGESEDFMHAVASKLNLSARVYDRILKVSRTIADLAGSNEVGLQHLGEAVQYRSVEF